MKKTILLVAFLSLLTVGVVSVSCSKDEDGGGGGGGIIDNTITATVEDGIYHSIDVVKAIVVTGEGHTPESNYWYWIGFEAAQSPYSNGGFTLELVATVSDAYLESVENEFSDGIISDPNVKIGWTAITGFKDGREVDDFDYRTAEKWEGELFYANGDVNITGSSADADKDRYKYDIHLKKGWNMIYIREIFKENHYELEATTKAPAGLKWYLSDDDEEVSNPVPGSLKWHFPAK